MLTGENITKRFGALIALKDVNFNLREGEILGLIGPNGAGKTTLFSVINGFLKLDAGKITYKGKEITNKEPYEICKRGIARTFQIPRPFSELTVLENIKSGAFGNTSKNKTKIENWLEILEISDSKDKIAKNLTFIEKRKLELGRALATNPDMILLDEIASGLHPKGINEITNTIQKLNDMGITIFWIEHVMKAIMSISGRIIVLSHGEKIAEGTPDQVSQNDHVVEAYLGESSA